MKINIDRGRCTGIGICESISPDHFEVGDDGELVVLNDVFPTEQLALMEQVVRSCPAKALSAAPVSGTAAPDGPA